MKSDNDKARTLDNNSENISATPSIALLNRRIGASPTPRMLTPYEIDLLRKCAEEVAQVTQEILAIRENNNS